MTKTTSTLAPASIEQHDGYAIQTFAPIQIGTTTFTVREQHFEAGYDSIMWLRGPRGAEYTLERTSTPGVYIAQSFASGQPMKRQGNVVKINWFGDIIEAA